MVSKVIIAVWSLICLWILIQAISHGPADGSVVWIIFFQLIVWGVVVVPTALIGLLFKKPERSGP